MHIRSRSALSVAPLAALAALAVLASSACSATPPAQTPTSSTVPKAAAPPTDTKITAFAISNENLRVDKVGLRDGFMKPDGNRDLAFTATIDGEFEALFLLSTNVKGEPGYGVRADTLSGGEEVPVELGTVVDTGRMTVGIGVIEGDGPKFINGETGSARGGRGVHELKLYVPNTATLKGGTYVRLYARAPGGAIVAGPITPY